MREVNRDEEQNDLEKAKRRAYAELVTHIENAVTNDKYIFKLVDLNQLYEKRMTDLGYSEFETKSSEPI